MPATEIRFGSEVWSIDPGRSKEIRGDQRQIPNAITDLKSAVYDALEKPIHYAPLRQALTPEDRLTLVVDDHSSKIGEVISVLLDYLIEEQINPERITLLSPPGENQYWIDELPERFQDVHTEVHDPDNRIRCCYLASTHQGRRVYLNRSLVDADQMIILSRRSYSSLTGYSGAETAIFPQFGDRETIKLLNRTISMENAGENTIPLRLEALEICWLLGSPFLIQLIEGYGDTISGILGGSLDTSSAGMHQLDLNWKIHYQQPVDLVIATITGTQPGCNFADLARAVANSNKILNPGGSLVILPATEVRLGEPFRQLAVGQGLENALNRLRSENTGQSISLHEWYQGKTNREVYIGPGINEKMVNILQAKSIVDEQELQKLLHTANSFTILKDGHKSHVSYN